MIVATLPEPTVRPPSRYLNSVFCDIFYAFYCKKQRKIVVFMWCIFICMISWHRFGTKNFLYPIIVVMSSITRLSQWVPFEVGMAAQVDMPTATFLKEDVMLPDFLQYWPRLKKVADIRKYVSASNDVDQEYQKFRPIYEEATFQQSKVERFYDVLKKRL